MSSSRLLTARVRGRPAARVAPVRNPLPSWAVSVWFHSFLLIAVAFGLRGCAGTGQRGEAESDAQTIGIVTQTDAGTGSEASASESSQSPTDTRLPALGSSDLPPADITSADTPPVDLPDLPGGNLPQVAGPSSGVPRFSSGATAERGGGNVRGTAGEGAGAAGGLARGETDFFGIRDKGETFVYVLDASGSMSEPDGLPMAAAKAELMASLESLDAEQQFQIIFYSERPEVMRLPGKPPEKLYWATDINRTLARQFIAVVRPDAGTNHMKALRAALEIAPDTIFFLTDAEDPALSPKDIDDVRRLNSGTRIHVVEFGKRARLEATSSLERLARQNRGAYQYRDVTRFGR